MYYKDDHQDLTQQKQNSTAMNLMNIKISLVPNNKKYRRVSRISSPPCSYTVLKHELPSLASTEELTELNCRSAAVSHVVWFFDILNCFSVSESTLSAWLSCCFSASAMYTVIKCNPLDITVFQDNEKVGHHHRDLKHNLKIIFGTKKSSWIVYFFVSYLSVIISSRLLIKELHHIMCRWVRAKNYQIIGNNKDESCSKTKIIILNYNEKG